MSIVQGSDPAALGGEKPQLDLTPHMMLTAHSHQSSCLLESGLAFEFLQARTAIQTVSPVSNRKKRD